jgi:MYXO-CTERM domain-containing protein
MPADGDGGGSGLSPLAIVAAAAALVLGGAAVARRRIANSTRGAHR